MSVSNFLMTIMLHATIRPKYCIEFLVPVLAKHVHPAGDTTPGTSKVNFALSLGFEILRESAAVTFLSFYSFPSPPNARWNALRPNYAAKLISMKPLGH